jgi:two-component system, LytTR family, sensor histidine kinase AlgZ
MHPILARPDRAWLVIAACAGAGVLILTLPLRVAGAGGDAGWFSAWGAALPLAALQSWHVVRYVSMAGSPFGRFAAAVAVTAVVAGGLWTAGGYAIARAAATLVPAVAPAMREIWPTLWIIGSAVFLCVLLLTYALDAADRGEAAARRALESDLASRDAELRALRAQVDPHFLFNCLHSISAMTSRDPATARRMCLELADFFRASVKAGAEQRIPLADELQLVRGYLGIEQVRFGDRLRVEVGDAGESGGAMVPPLLLQPLVENAVRHGIATLVEGGTVRVGVRSDGGRVTITVENPFDPDGRRPGTGVGLANVRGRLETAYRGAAMIRVDTTPEPSMAFRVLVSIPAESAEERRETVGQ